MLSRKIMTAIYISLCLGVSACASASPTPDSASPSSQAPIPATLNQPEPASATSVQDENNVLAAALQAHYGSLNVERIVLLDQTRLPQEIQADTDYLRRELGTALHGDTLQNFMNNNSQSRSIQHTPELDIPVELISQDRFDAFFSAVGETGWETFYQEYPGAGGITGVSRVGFGPEGKQAIIYLEDRAPEDSAQGLYIFLTKSGATWSVERVLVAWVS